MTEKDIKKRINDSLLHSKPNNLDKILLECEELKRKELKMKKTEKNEKHLRGWIKNLSFVACGVVIALIAVFGVNRISKNMVDSIIALDVNPSIELEVNKEEKILKAKALNDEAKTVLKDMDLKDTDLNVAVNAIVGSMVKNGYIDEIKNSILVSVTNDDSDKGAEIQTKVAKEIDEILKGSNIEGAVLSQTVDIESDAEKLAAEYDITAGKVQLINEIIAKDSTLNFEDLAKMSINDLNLINESRNVKTSDTTNETATSSKVTTSGTSSTKGYIGETKAKEIALKDAGVTNTQIYNYEYEFDSDNGVLVYELEFKSKYKEFEYDINAITGAIVNKKAENNDDYEEDLMEGEVPSSVTGSTNSSTNNSSSSSSSNLISKSKAKSIALSKAGVSSSNIRDYEIELDTDDGVQKYEISFKSGNIEYDIDVNAKNGNVIKFEKETDRDDD